ncbi:MAG: XdhC family protein [Pontixanthobacter sp.]
MTDAALALSRDLAATDSDHAALLAAYQHGVALCTIVGIEGSFSRRLGAQMAVLSDGSTIGSLADGCLEKQLASDARDASVPVVKRYGSGSPVIDFRLPCGGGLDILVDPAPDRAACRKAASLLERRKPAMLPLPENFGLAQRQYSPALKIAAFGEGPELDALAAIGRAAGIDISTRTELSAVPDLDRWTAIVLLFHDHDRERDILAQAVQSDAFYIGAQGGENARNARIMQLLADGVPEEQIARIRGPIGSVPGCRTPTALALSILSEVVGHYEGLKSHR